ncbi:MAG: SufE family protein [Sumerlaeia bacterium]
MNEIQQAQQEVIQQFDGCVDWEDRYQRIIDLGKEHGDIPEEFKVEKFRVKGCQSTVYLHASLNGERVHFQATSDAMIVKGLVSLLMQVYNNRKPQEILSTPPSFIKEIGLSENLSQGRANGLASMIQQITLYAQAFSAMLQTKS